MEDTCIRMIEVLSVYDGDTITGAVILGLNVVAEPIKIRLFGIDAPEMRGPERPEGTITRDWLRDRILGERIPAQFMGKNCDKKGKFGRFLAYIFGNEGASQSLNQEMVDRGLAEPAEY